jgi:iron complex outermembrane receptor protein
MKIEGSKKRVFYKTAFYASSTAAALMVALPAVAQSFGDEIIVTAQKREQSLQDVPIAVQVVDSEFIESLAADNISDISQFIPGLDVGAGSPTQPRYKIRGISTSDFGVGTDAAVGVYVDGVYSARSGAAVLSFGDVERIEVLKGPQGTLFGRNSAAGAVSIITKKPTQEFEGMALARVGNYGKKRGEITLNVPVSDMLAFRVNALYNERDGLFTDAATGEDLSRQQNWAARAALRWQPTDLTDVTLSWVHDELDQDARPAIGIVPIPAAPATPGIPPDPSTYFDPFVAPVFNDVIDNHETRNLDEATLIINHDFGGVTLTSTSSWRQFETENREDEDGTNRIDLYFDTNNREENESWYQELKLAGETGAFNWLMGASYFTEDANQISDTLAFSDSINTVLGNIGAGTPFTDLENGLLIPFMVPATLLGHPWREAMFNEGEFSAYAVYGDVIWSVNDRLNLTFGGRYTHDEKKFQWLNGLREAPGLDGTLTALDDMGLLGLAGASPADFLFDIVFDLNGLAGVPCDNGVTVTEGVACVLEDQWDNFSPRFVIDYALSDNVLGYASYTKGYKAGGFNSVEVASRFDNEDVTNIEVGIKSRFPESSVTFNTSGFHYTYNDKQSISLVQTAGSNVPQYVVQTSDDQAWGADIQILWSPSEPLYVFANAQIIDSTFKNRVTSSGTDLSGQPTGEPTFSAGFGAKYTHELESGGNISLQGAHAYRGASRQNTDSIAQGTATMTTAFETGTAQNRTDLRLSWVSESEQIEWGVFANNVFDNRYVTGVNNLTANTFGTPFAGITQPRFWGSDLRFKF